MSIHDSGHPMPWRVFSEPKAHWDARQNPETAAGLTRSTLAHRSDTRTGGIWAVLPSGRPRNESTRPSRMKNARRERFVHGRSPGEGPLLFGRAEQPAFGLRLTPATWRYNVAKVRYQEETCP